MCLLLIFCSFFDSVLVSLMSAQITKKFRLLMRSMPVVTIGFGAVPVCGIMGKEEACTLT